MAWIPSQFRLNGGLNEEDPEFTLAPGALRFCRNIECLPGGGYRKIEGYERFDGHVAKPSLATYYSIPFINGGPREVANGDSLVGVTSGATAKAVGYSLLTSGTWSSSNAAGKVGYVPLTGTFVSGENVTAGGIVAFRTSGVGTIRAVDDINYKTWLAGARDYYRTLISAVPGTGGVLGCFVLKGVTYALRGQGGPPSTTVNLYKATTSGWSLVTLTNFIRFTAGTGEIFEGDTVTGGTSAATGVVRRVNIGAGNWAGPTFASGRLAIDTITGTFQAAEALKVGGVSKATCSGAQAVPTFTAGGRFSFVNNNFYGSSNQQRVYGADGVNRAFEFDGTYFINIETGMTTDTPRFIESHRGCLFLGFPGGSLQNSGYGQPLIWSPRIGAGEIGIGDDITGIKSNGNNTMAITCASRISILNGTSDADWSLRSISDEIGSVAYTMQESGGQTLFLDRSAINVVIPAPLAYQEISTQAVSKNVRKTIEAKAPLAIDSIHAIKKSQYRLYFSDKTGLCATYYGSKLVGFSHLQYAHQVTCSCHGTDASGVERMYFGTDTGYLMELDAGTSFDGSPIETIMQLPYCYHKYPDRDKRFHKLTLEVSTPRAIELRIGQDFNYGGGGQTGQITVQTNPTGGIWDTSSWDQFFWDSAVLSAPEINISGVANNMGITLYHSDAVDDPFTISACLLQFSLFGIRR